ncbi:hypothetical protein LEP1GSC132_2141 [Leptospira kirschneri str. 200803703]|nr:hypothetical protein LEP1GSC176_3499 [Leptospira kirschneri str. MMD1493]EMN25217.1 hypothetical protein LEP1GSC065_2223 [Leptospira kirschneri serovar Sokoine str. RM1]EMO65452.1 hypothetical protein LEP1GSC132_2141 [Leptospira kirschneri str. 200803703]
MKDTLGKQNIITIFNILKKDSYLFRSLFRTSESKFTRILKPSQFQNGSI